MNTNAMITASDLVRNEARRAYEAGMNAAVSGNTHSIPPVAFSGEFLRKHYELGYSDVKAEMAERDKYRISDKLEATTPEPVAKPAPRFKKGDKVCHRINGLRGTVHVATNNPPFECAVDWGGIGGTHVESELELDETPAASPEPMAGQGQVWVVPQGEPLAGRAYIVHYIQDPLKGRWRTVCLSDVGWWFERDTAQEAVAGLTFAAPTVADYYQRELLARVAELEVSIVNMRQETFKAASNIAHCAAGGLQAMCVTPEGQEYRASINEALAAAREQGAKQAREERFQAYRLPHGSGLWAVYDNTEQRIPKPECSEFEARAEAARLNAAEKGTEHA